MKKLSEKAKKRIIFLAKIVVSVSLIALLFYYIDIGAVWQALKQIYLPLFFVAIGMQILFIATNSYKWKILLPYPYKTLFAMTYVSQFYAAILPGQVMGEAAKIIYMKRYCNDLENVAASVIVDKASSFLGIFVIGAIGLIADLKGNIAIGIVFLVASILIIMFLIFLRFEKPYNFLCKVIDLISKKIKFFSKVKNFISSLRYYSKRTDLLIKSVLLAVVCQFIGVLMYFVVCTSLSITISIWSLMWIYASLSVAVFIPISVAGIGLREVTLVGLLGIYGVSSQLALAFSLIILFLTVLSGFIGGIVSFKFMLTVKKDNNLKLE